MDLHLQLAELAPKTKALVFDCVEQAGYNTSNWIASASVPHMAKANPKYCYEWSFIQPGEVVIFNLWHDIMEVVDGQIVFRENFRANAEHHRQNGGKQQWITRGDKLDHAVSVAAQEGLPVRVIVLDGERRNTKDPNSRSSRVAYRQLDEEPWHVRKYDRTTGDFILARGEAKLVFQDQLDVLGVEYPERVETSAFQFSRNAHVRRSVLSRAQGRCEFCSQQGFAMSGGSVYLETHHVVPLAEGGSDIVTNVVALCATDHKRAHFSVDREAMRTELLHIASRGSSVPII